MRLLRAVAAMLTMAALLTGCGPNREERREGLELARLLRQIAPEAKDLLERETVCAAEFKITLEEAGPANLNTFRGRFEALVGNMIAIRDRRRELQAKVRQVWWGTPLVRVVQASAIMAFQDELTRTESWITLARDVRFRAELGRQQEFPEIEVLKKQLEFFLGEGQQAPLSRQLAALVEQDKFSDREISP